MYNNKLLQQIRRKMRDPVRIRVGLSAVQLIEPRVELPASTPQPRTPQAQTPPAQVLDAESIQLTPRPYRTPQEDYPPGPTLARVLDTSDLAEAETLTPGAAAQMTLQKNEEYRNIGRRYIRALVPDYDTDNRFSLARIFKDVKGLVAIPTPIATRPEDWFEDNREWLR